MPKLKMNSKAAHTSVVKSEATAGSPSIRYSKPPSSDLNSISTGDWPQEDIYKREFDLGEKNGNSPFSGVILAPHTNASPALTLKSPYPQMYNR